MRDSLGSHAGLAGLNSFKYSPSQSADNSADSCSGCKRVGGKRGVKHIAEHTSDLVYIAEENPQTRSYIKNKHRRNDFGRKRADTFNSTHQNEESEQGDNPSRKQGGDAIGTE